MLHSRWTFVRHVVGDMGNTGNEDTDTTSQGGCWLPRLRKRLRKALKALDKLKNAMDNNNFREACGLWTFFAGTNGAEWTCFLPDGWWWLLIWGKKHWRHNWKPFDEVDPSCLLRVPLAKPSKSSLMPKPVGQNECQTSEENLLKLEPGPVVTL